MLFALLFLNTLLFCVAGLPSLDVHYHLVYFLFYVAQYFLLAGILKLLMWPCTRLRYPALKFTLMGLIETIGIAFVFMNAKVFAFWHVFVNRELLELFLEGRSQVFEIGFDTYVWIAATVSLALLAGFLILLIVKRYASYFSRGFRVGTLVFAGIYLAAQSIFLAAAYTGNMQILQPSLSLPYFYETSWVSLLRLIGLNVLPEQSFVSQLHRALLTHQHWRYPKQPLQYHAPAAHLNVLLIVVDTLRYDMVNPVNMPNVSQLSEKSQVFLDNISGGDCTRPGIFSLFYGMPSTHWSVALRDQQGAELIRAFQQNHYDMKLLASASLASPPFDRTVFATVPDLSVMTPGDDAVVRDAKVTEEMDSFLEKEAKKRTHKRPFFGFIFYDGPHAYNAINIQKPFSPVKALNYFNTDNNTNPVPIFNLYKNAVFYDDQLIEKILHTLKKNDLLKNTVVIFTSDHGQEFNDYHNNYWEHASGFSKYQVRTPLLILWPGKKHAVHEYQTTHFDLTPTLLKGVLGVSNKTEDYAAGNDFFSPNQSSFVIVGNYAYYAVVTKDRVMEFHNSGLYRFYDTHMTPLPQEKPDPTLMRAVLQELNE